MPPAGRARGRLISSASCPAISVARPAAWLALAASLCALLGLASPAAAARYEVYVLTMSPGDHPFERIGHTALGVKDLKERTELIYNFGTFDFEDPDLWQKALHKRLPYWVSAMNSGVVALRYATREIRAQRIALDDEQAGRLALRLAEEAQAAPGAAPGKAAGHRTFDYDQFTNNCVTRVRDALDDVTGGALRRQAEAPSGRTYRQLVLQTLRDMAVLRAIADAVYGRYTDAPRSRWEAMFLPWTLHDGLADLSIGEGAARRPLVSEERVWRDEAYQAPGPWPDPVLVVAVASALLLGAGAVYKRRGLRAAAWALLVAVSTLGALAVGSVGLLLAYASWSRAPHAWLRESGARPLLVAALLAAPLLLHGAHALRARASARRAEVGGVGVDEALQ